MNGDQRSKTCWSFYYSKKENASKMSNKGNIRNEGVNILFYRRKESFRFTFDPPETAMLQFTGNDSESSIYTCDLVDISPGGARLFTTFRFDQYSSTNAQLKFTLFKKELCVAAEMVWKRPSRNGTLIGLQFLKNEMDVITELKLRRYKDLEDVNLKKGKRF